MKIVSFQLNGNVSYGVIENNEIMLIEGDIFGDFVVTDTRVSLDEIKILPPVVPSKAVCIGLNYHDHIEETNSKVPDRPVVFIKPSTAVIGHMDDIKYPELSKRVDYEGELAVVIGKKAKDINVNEAKEYIFGYTCGNDVTARDLQPADGQWTVSKSFDTFLPLGPWIETELDPLNLEIRTFLNDELKQSSNTRHLIFDPYTLVSYISQIMTLLHGDIILTGTPSGIGPMKKGDKVVVEIENIGSLINYVK
ncbi:MAG TPA: fumarylacetoacetate hydrolase family protein [Tepidanaerobacteraceae bacterium]|nr:fumarylacetoacetate hydrolase family protein [Tepidanaerobacteraceae bacterium]HQE06018.1 fumarylacetoacetate hydrolase family protein [Tepidanaerobacteraceae bacterium]